MKNTNNISYNKNGLESTNFTQNIIETSNNKTKSNSYNIKIVDSQHKCVSKNNKNNVSMKKKANQQKLIKKKKTIMVMTFY